MCGAHGNHEPAAAPGLSVSPLRVMRRTPADDASEMRHVMRRWCQARQRLVAHDLVRAIGSLTVVLEQLVHELRQGRAA
jgi:hypothetical protein